MPVPPIVTKAISEDIAIKNDTITTNTTTTKTLKSKEMLAIDHPILWWTPPPQYQLQPQPQLELPFVLSDCGLDFTCTISQDRSLLLGGEGEGKKKASVVLFQGSEIDTSDMPGTQRDAFQAWVLNSVFDSPNDPRLAKTLSGFPFTHLWSYSFDADFVETHFRPSTPVEESLLIASSSSSSSSSPPNARNAFLEAVTAPPKVDLTEKNRLRALAKTDGGKAPAVWIVNKEGDNTEECKDSPSGRENYIRELVKMMDIDIYGPCMNNTAWPIHPDSQKPYSPQEIMVDYKFVFALETVNCQDYVTSTLADALVVGAIPIVDGPKDYTRFSPTKDALIRLDTFIAPELLAQELDGLDRSDTLYLDRLGYKIPPRAVSRDGSGKLNLSSLFKQTFNKDTSTKESLDVKVNATAAVDAWGPDLHGAYCGICQLAHDISESKSWTALTTTTKTRESTTEDSATFMLSTCESEPRYLPGLPVQMKAYDEYLQHQSEEYLTKQPIVHSIGVKVTFDQPKHDPPSDTWIQSGNVSPAVIHHAGETTPTTAETLVQQQRLGDKAIPPPFEMFYLLVLILVLCVGMIVLLLITSKSARRMLLWPWRNLFYSKIPDNDQDSHSLERVMLRELGEDLLYE
ncbi:glycosyltransferase family 10-domain-containing protein [Dissophora ornata]|nr:glycosyltransferase family 10-domain-containing protein [Dissophora ornata]